MGFLAFLPLINTLIDKIFPDKARQDEAKAEMMRILAESEKAQMTAKSDVIVAEAKGESPAQRNWRPHLMYLFMAIIANNYIIAPLLASFGVVLPVLPVPDHMWTLIEICVGGYIVGRSVEKTATTFNDGAFFSKLRSKFGGLTQTQVDAFNQALTEGKK